MYEDLIDLFAYAVEGAIAINEFHKWLIKLGAEFGTRMENRVSFGRDSPNHPDAKYQHAKTYEQLLADFSTEGSHHQLHRRGIVALTYAKWEDQYRKKIAEDCCLVDDKGVVCKNRVKSDIFKELNWYRQAILHRNGKLKEEPRILCFARKGDTVSFTGNHMYELFSILIDELNRIGEAYYGKNPRFSLDKLLNQPN
ncbi:MAG: hypothetical protein OXM87_05140 [Truepera sp.]|nr:hypothetical protein [Truepera sp.]